MTFLIFLASLAALEYVLRPKLDKRAERTIKERAAGLELRVEDVSREDAPGDDLHALGTALDALGRGQKPACGAELLKTRAPQL